MNRLARESSPYLRQHAHNPVEWYPWGEEAFERARAEDKPILLSIGYAACHWCHVMAHESFEDDETAKLLNRLFVNVKVDREERPDVDAIYMEAVQAMTGHGGWPMTVFLTPEGEPFHGGTYFPKVARAGLPSFAQLCSAIAQAWAERRPELLEQAGRLTELLRRSTDLAPAPDAGLPEARLVAEAAGQLLQRFDPAWGGFGSAPKFPQPDLHDLLLRHHVRAAREGSAGTDALDAVTTTLDAMAAGGIYDHLGGGFARYSVDRQWLVPHFEKMLYDQAGLVRLYLHAWQVTGVERFLQVVGETIEYVLRDLRHPAGAFYSSEDADSEGEEGRFYVWARAEIEEVAGEDAAAAIDWWGVTEPGNFEGRSILHRPVRGRLERPSEVERARQALFRARSQRVRPGLDDKVLTEWNGLFIAALAEAGAATGRDEWVAGARRAAEFLLENLRGPGGRWWRSWQEEVAGAGGEPPGSRPLAFAADYAALLGAFVALAEATGEARWVTEARKAADDMLNLFWDAERGGFFTTGKDADPLITRAKDVIDGVIPSANGAAALHLLRLSALTGESGYREAAEGVLRLLAEPLARHPTAFPVLLGAVEMATTTTTEVAVVGDRPDLVRAVHSRWLPNTVLAWGEPYASPLFEGRSEGLAYVCRNFACQSPTGDVDDLVSQLSQA